MAAKAPPKRLNGKPHLSECLQRTAYEMDWPDKDEYRCTCLDYSPD